MDAGMLNLVQTSVNEKGKFITYYKINPSVDSSVSQVVTWCVYMYHQNNRLFEKNIMLHTLFADIREHRFYLPHATLIFRQKTFVL